ncbi:MAG: AAA family ATPase, partial [Caldilineaceae bacterium]|nr:AAA family ATPase [Caldilineaceae bacterium]
MNLFEQAQKDRQEKESPLAARMRPRTLDEYIGQEHIVGPGRLLRRAIQADQLGSIILYGPPGTGKTTLAKVISNSTNSHFITLNAVLSGVKDIREAVADAQERANLYAQRTTLFIDEVHRFNKAQQDALLPWVENGTVIFIGATTENPYFEVNKALVSRSRIFQLLPLQPDHIRKIILQALHNAERGYGNLHIEIDDDALDHLVNVANGDARAALNALELAVETTGPPASQSASQPVSQSPIHITLEIAEESIQQRAVLYDKEGDYHFDTISAFIKSLRGSDPDAALYWMAKMVYAGESPRFIFRRMIIFAGEDIGMADPNAISVAMACAQAFEYVGLPEGRFHLAEAAIYLATAPKSNSTFAFFDALTHVKEEADSGVPNHLRDANRDKEGFGHGEGYLYPHAYRDHWVAQQYLPTSLQGKLFYQPSDQGYEARIRHDVARKREAQLAAMLAQEADSPGHDAAGVGIEVFTFSPDDPARERWLQRTVSNAGAHLGQLRDRVLDNARLSRHSLVLDLKAGSGLLTWEAVRRTPEGGVYALAHSSRDAEALRQMAAQLNELERPFVLEGTAAQLPELGARAADTLPQLPQQFDALVGHNALLEEPDKAAFVSMLNAHLLPAGRLSLAERIAKQNQRLYNLVDLAELDADLCSRIQQAEEAIYADDDDPLVNWDAPTLIAALEKEGLTVTHQIENDAQQVQITEALLARWFAPKG